MSCYKERGFYNEAGEDLDRMMVDFKNGEKVKPKEILEGDLHRCDW